MTAVVAPAVDAAWLLGALRRIGSIGSTPAGGVSRPAFSEADIAARAEVMDMMRAAGLTVTVDAAANIIALPHGVRSGSVVLMGSHFDSVVEGGRYDGTYGVLAAIEVVRTLRRQEAALAHPVGVVVFADEEGTCFPRGLWGSRAVLGDVAPEELDMLAEPERRRRFEVAGGRPGHLDEARWPAGSVAVYLELHVEQGPVLESVGATIGVVDGITGRLNFDVQIEGEAGHAGTTPMAARRDALVAAAELVLAVRERCGTVVRSATIGELEVVAGARNVVPGTVRLVGELRDVSVEALEAGEEELGRAAARVAGHHGLTVDVRRRGFTSPASCHPGVRAAVADAAEGLGLQHVTLSSAAGHDAQVIARAVPTGMIFVPSVGGLSHVPAEYTPPAALVAGTQVLLETLVACDRRQRTRAER